MRKPSIGVSVIGVLAIIILIVLAVGSRKSSEPVPAVSEINDAPQAQAAKQVDPEVARKNALPGNAAVPGSYPIVVSSEVGILVDQLEFGGRPHEALVSMGPSIVPQLLAALQTIAAQQSGTPLLSEDEITRLERRKLQLYRILGKLASPDAAPILIEVALQSRPDSYSFIYASEALDSIGASTEADRFAADLASRPDASKAMLMAAFHRFEVRVAPPLVVEVAEKWIDPLLDYRIRNSALRIVAISGRQAQAWTAIESALANGDRNIDYTALSGLAETVAPDEFASRLEKATMSDSLRKNALEHNRFAWADSSEKTRLSGDMLRKGRPLQAHAIAFKHVLETGQPDLLSEYDVVRIVPDATGQSWTMNMSRVHRTLIARLGYEISLTGTEMAIHRSGAARP